MSCPPSCDCAAVKGYIARYHSGDDALLSQYLEGEEYDGEDEDHCCRLWENMISKDPNEMACYREMCKEMRATTAATMKEIKDGDSGSGSESDSESDSDAEIKEDIEDMKEDLQDVNHKVNKIAKDEKHTEQEVKAIKREEKLMKRDYDEELHRIVKKVHKMPSFPPHHEQQDGIDYDKYHIIGYGEIPRYRPEMEGEERVAHQPLVIVEPTYDGQLKAYIKRQDQYIPGPTLMEEDVYKALKNCPVIVFPSREHPFPGWGPVQRSRMTFPKPDHNQRKIPGLVRLAKGKMSVNPRWVIKTIHNHRNQPIEKQLRLMTLDDRDDQYRPVTRGRAGDIDVRARHHDSIVDAV